MPRGAALLPERRIAASRSADNAGPGRRAQFARNSPDMDGFCRTGCSPPSRDDRVAPSACAGVRPGAEVSLSLQAHIPALIDQHRQGSSAGGCHAAGRHGPAGLQGRPPPRPGLPVAGGNQVRAWRRGLLHAAGHVSQPEYERVSDLGRKHALLQVRTPLPAALPAFLARQLHRAAPANPAALHGFAARLAAGIAAHDGGAVQEPACSLVPGDQGAGR